FGRHLAQIREAGQRVRRLYELWSGRATAPENQSAVVLTFDDGRATDYEVAFPLLLAAGVRAEFFVNTATIERAGHLTWSQIMEMHRAGMSFQSHADHHVLLPRLPERLLRNELPPAGRGQPVGRPASPGGRVARVDGLDLRVVVLIDAFGWEIAQRLGFLSDALPHRAPVRTVLGYSSGAIPTMLTGKSPAEHGHWNLFYYDPEGSPFRCLRGLHFLPDGVLGHVFVRK